MVATTAGEQGGVRVRRGAIDVVRGTVSVVPGAGVKGGVGWVVSLCGASRVAVGGGWG